MNDWYARVMSLAAIFACHGAVPAHAMTDPTQPPRAVTAGEGAAGSAKALTLQSVMILPHRRSAIIDGARVEIGGRIGEAEVLKISETEVTLRHGSRIEILKMYPDIEKKGPRSADPAQPKAPVSRSRP